MHIHHLFSSFLYASRHAYFPFDKTMSVYLSGASPIKNPTRTFKPRRAVEGSKQFQVCLRHLYWLIDLRESAQEIRRSYTRIRKLSRGRKTTTGRRPR